LISVDCRATKIDLPFSFPDLDASLTKSFYVDSSSAGLTKIISFTELKNNHQGVGTTVCSLKYLMTSNSAGLTSYSLNGIALTGPSIPSPGTI
jgi:hypothetical protein